MNEILEIIDKFIYWILGIAGVIWALLKVIYKLKQKAEEDAHAALSKAIKEEVKARKEDIETVMKAIKTSEDNYKRSNEQLLQTFKDGIKEEREFRTNVMVRQQEYIEKIFEKLEILSNDVSQLSTQLVESVKAQEKICAIRHEA